MLILEQRDITQAAVLLEVENAVTKSSSTWRKCSLGNLRQRHAVHGVSTTISCAPTVFMRSNMPSARRSTPPSTRNSGARS